MAFSEIYKEQAGLLVRLLPIVAEEKCFALKGGTAINLFVRDMPRLSVDIDLTYLPIEDRATSLAGIEAALIRIKGRIEHAVPGSRITPKRIKAENALTGLLVSARAQVKIEVTPVLRGSVFPAETRRVAPLVEDAFGFAEMQLLPVADLYAGKLVAALDRQHPRDLFDARLLLAADGIDDSLRDAFAVYLISHDRPMAEVLNFRSKDITIEFERGFTGMTDAPVVLDDLLAVRPHLKELIVDQMPDAHRRLLVSVECGEPDWSLLDVPHVADLPAVRWRLQNIRSLDPQHREKNVAVLTDVLAARRAS